MQLWTLITLPRRAKSKKFLCPSSSQRGQLSGEKKLFLVSTFFARAAGQTVSLPSNLPRNLALLPQKVVRLSLTLHNSGYKGRNARLFSAINKPVEWRFQWGGTFYVFDLFWLHSGQNRGPTVNFLVLFSRFRLISQARKVEMTHFKSPKSSTGCGQCREALGKGPTPSWG